MSRKTSIAIYIFTVPGMTNDYRGLDILVISLKLFKLRFKSIARYLTIVFLSLELAPTMEVTCIRVF